MSPGHRCTDWRREVVVGAALDLERLVHGAPEPTLGEEGHVFGVEVELLDFFDSAKQETRALGHCQWDQKVYDSLPFKRGQL